MQFFWIIAVNLSRSLIKLVPKNVKIRKLAAHGSVGWKVLRSVEVLKNSKFWQKLLKEEKLNLKFAGDNSVVPSGKTDRDYIIFQ